MVCEHCEAKYNKEVKAQTKVAKDYGWAGAKNVKMDTWRFNNNRPRLERHMLSKQVEFQTVAPPPSLTKTRFKLLPPPPSLTKTHLLWYVNERHARALAPAAVRLSPLCGR